MNNIKGRIKRRGYWYVKKWDHPNSGKQGYVAEHRLVMEARMGRYLLPQEAVHHINHNPADNRIENLQLFATHGEHTKYAHPEIHEGQKGLTIKQRTCAWCKNTFDYTWKTKKKLTCSEPCRQKAAGLKRKGRKATPNQLLGLAHGHGWNKGVPMTWQARGSKHHRYKHGKYSEYEPT